MTSERDLIEQLRRQPDDLGTLSVLADLLTQQGDPHGELIALDLAGRASSERSAVLERELGLPIEATWRNGFLHQVVIDTDDCKEHRLDPLDLLSRIFAARIGALLESIALAVGDLHRDRRKSQEQMNAMLVRIRESAPPTMRELVLRRLPGCKAALNAESIDPIAIERLVLSGSGHRGDRLEDLKLSRLTSLTLDGAPLKPGSARDLVRLLDRWFAPSSVPKLRRLVLLSPIVASHFCLAHLDRGLLQQLEELELLLPPMEDAAIEALVNHKEALSRIRLVFSGMGSDFEWHHLGLLTSSLGRIDEARAAYDRSLELNPEFLVAHHNRARLEHEHGDRALAKALYQRAIKAGEHARSDEPWVRELRASTLVWYGQLLAELEDEEAGPILDRAQEIIEWSMTAGDLARRSGRAMLDQIATARKLLDR